MHPESGIAKQGSKSFVPVVFNSFPDISNFSRMSLKVLHNGLFTSFW